MSIRFQCPHCNSIRAANERMAGKKIRCPVCTGNVQLPTLQEIADAEREAQQNARLQAQLSTVSATSSSAATYGDNPRSRSNAPTATVEEEPEAESLKFEKKKNRDDSEMDMTPMVDVTFLLLIFFMITASFSIQKVFRTPAQKSNEASINAVPDPNQDNSDSVIVQIDEFNSYTVLLPSGEEREIPSKQDLIVLLSEAKGEGDQGPSKLIIRAHEDSTHSTVVAALDAGRDARFERFELTTIEELD